MTLRAHENRERRPFDTWANVTHSQYSNAVGELLEHYRQKYSPTTKLTADHAEEFVKWISGETPVKQEFINFIGEEGRAALATVKTWRKGFLQSIIVSRAAMEANCRLTAAEAKAIARHVVNSDEGVKLTSQAASALSAVKASGKAGLLRVAKKVLPCVVAFSYFQSAVRGYAGEGHTSSGLCGAGHEVCRDLVMADLVESIVFPAAESVTTWIEKVLNMTRGREAVQLKRGLSGLKTYGADY